jgi:60 kDa SS-A/Ro ribonucleoprotein
MTRGWEGVGEDPHPDKVLAMIWAFERAKSLREKKDVGLLVELIREHRLPHECVPTEMKRYPEIWEVLLPEMGLTAMLRNLGKMTEVGLLGAFSDAERLVVSRLERAEALRQMTLRYRELMHANQPVHEWPLD